MEIHEQYFRVTQYRIIIFKEVIKIFSPNRDVILFFLLINKIKIMKVDKLTCYCTI